MAFEDLNVEQKIARGKVRLSREQPFFGSLAYHLNPVAVEGKVKESLSGRTRYGGVTEKGTLLYLPEGVDDLPEEQLVTFLAHESLHPGFNHFQREGERQHLLSNIAQDIVINNILDRNGFVEIESGIWPEDNEVYLTINGNIKIIKDLNEKSYEEVYDILLDKLQEDDIDPEDIDDEGTQIELPEGHDGHIREELAEEVEKEFPEAEVSEDRDDEYFDRKMREAKQESSRSQGSAPAGMGLRMEEKKKSKIDWRSVVQYNMASSISIDYTFSEPNFNYYNIKKEDDEGNMRRLYLPSEERKGLDVIVAVDTSGSVGQEELEQFVGDIYSLASAFDGVEMKVIQHDSKVHKVDELNSARALEDLDYVGGGGTSHIPVIEELEEENERNTIFIGFTDGYTNWPKQKRFSSLGITPIWVIDNYQVDPPYGRVLRNAQR